MQTLLLHRFQIRNLLRSIDTIPALHKVTTKAYLHNIDNTNLQAFKRLHAERVLMTRVFIASCQTTHLRQRAILIFVSVILYNREKPHSDLCSLNVRFILS